MSLLRLARPRLISCQFQPTLRTLTTTPRRFEEVSTSPEPSLDPKTTIQSALKSALRSKDKPRLDVLRTILSEITNASKTSKPVSTPAQLHSLLLRQIKSSRASIAEFKSAKREDLVGKESAQVEILEEIKAGIPTVENAELDMIVQEVVGSLMEGEETLGFGSVMKKCQEVLKGRPHDSHYLVQKIKEGTEGTSGKKHA